ncbi:MAG: hypothetical protein AAFY56_14060 [Pseudomonadota bacterium]
MLKLGLSLLQSRGGLIASEITGAPVLSGFVDELDLDPPAVFFTCDTVGATITFDFHTTLTDPGKGSGNIGTTTDTASSGLTEYDLSTFLGQFPGDTGYVYIRATSAGLDSNVLVTQQITLDGFSPANLFGVSDEGGFWDAETSNAWQNTGKTVSANAGDQVRVIEDLSGNLNDLVAASDTVRPIKTDLGGGVTALRFDGADDLIGATNLFGVISLTDSTIVVAMQHNGTGTGANNLRSVGFGSKLAGNNAPVWNWARDGSIRFDDGFVDAGADIGDDMTVISIKKSGDDYSAEVDGVEVLAPSTQSSRSIRDDFFIGNVTEANLVTTDIVFVFAIDRVLTAQELSDLTSHAAIRSGVTL